MQDHPNTQTAHVEYTPQPDFRPACELLAYLYLWGGLLGLAGMLALIIKKPGALAALCIARRISR